MVVMHYPEISEKNTRELQSFLFINRVLKEMGLRAPEIYEADIAQGFVILEDFGQVSFGRAVREGGDQNTLYTLACDVLKIMKQVEMPDTLQDYRYSRIYENRRQILDFYAPIKTKKYINNNILKDFIDTLDSIERGLPPCPQGFLHADFHLENLMWLEEGEGLSRCGIIDFQDALLGPLPYDLVNLLEDARVDVPSHIKAEILEQYCKGMTREERKTFDLWFRYLAVQFHGRVIGLCLKWALESNRDSYLVHIPRLQNYIKEGLMHPVMTPLRLFFEKEKIDFLPFEAMNGDALRAVYRSIPSDH